MEKKEEPRSRRTFCSRSTSASIKARIRAYCISLLVYRARDIFTLAPRSSATWRLASNGPGWRLSRLWSVTSLAGRLLLPDRREFGANDRTVHRMQAEPQRSGQWSISNLTVNNAGLRSLGVPRDNPVYHQRGGASSPKSWATTSSSVLILVNADGGSTR